MGKKTKKIKKGRGGIKKACIALLLMLGMIFPVSAFAQDIISFNSLNIAGDTLYLPSSGTFAVGVGTDIATIFDVATIRGEYVAPMDDSGNRGGIGIGINLPKLVAKIGGSWVADNINASIGVTALINLNGDVHIEPALYLSVISFSR